MTKRLKQNFTKRPADWTHELSNGAILQAHIQHITNMLNGESHIEAYSLTIQKEKGKSYTAGVYDSNGRVKKPPCMSAKKIGGTYFPKGMKEFRNWIILQQVLES